MISELGDEPVKCDQHPDQYLYFFRIARQLEALHGIDLIWVDLYPLISDQITQELTSSYTESTLLSIKAQLVLPKYIKRSLKILYMLTFLFAFTTISSMYTSTVHPVLSWNILVIIR